MNTKQLRRIHRARFTRIDDKGDRVKTFDYIPFKEWLRNLDERQVEELGPFTGKAAMIRG
jgi:hypothetical protein